MEKSIREKVAARLPELKKLIFGEETPAEPVKVEAASVTLVDGTQVSVSPALEVGATATVMDSEGKEIPAPDGSHEAQDGTVFTIAGGVITEVKPIEEAKTAEPTTAPVADAAMRAELDAAKVEMAALKSEITGLRDSLKSMFSVVHDIAQAPAATPTETDPKPFEFSKDYVSWEDKLKVANKVIFGIND